MTMTERATKSHRHGAEPADFVFDAESDASIDNILKKYPPDRQASAVLPLLDLAQRQMKRQTGSAWVPRVAMNTAGMPGLIKAIGPCFISAAGRPSA